jgi:transcriptional regulator with XRE-family HTH domain
MSKLRDRRKQRFLTQEELADLVGVHPLTVRRWEGGQVPQPLHIRQLSEVLEATPIELGFDGGSTELSALEIEPGDLPDQDELESAVTRLKRAYSTTPPGELKERIDVRLRQIRRLLEGETRSPRRRQLLEAAGWLALLRATAQADASQFEDAHTSLYVARDLARRLGHTDLEAWTYETGAWMAATDRRQRAAFDLADRGVQIAPLGGYALVAATLQRGRISGALHDEKASIRDLIAGEHALAAIREPGDPADHYVLDGAKAAFFASGALAQLRRPAETIEHAAEVVRSNEDPRTHNYWPMRVANARLEWAMALADQGEEDAAVAMATQALDPQWTRPDTDRRTRMLLARLRDPRLHAELAGRLEEALIASKS